MRGGSGFRTFSQFLLLYFHKNVLIFEGGVLHGSTQASLQGLLLSPAVALVGQAALSGGIHQSVVLAWGEEKEVPYKLLGFSHQDGLQYRPLALFPVREHIAPETSARGRRVWGFPFLSTFSIALFFVGGININRHSVVLPPSYGCAPGFPTQSTPHFFAQFDIFLFQLRKFRSVIRL